MSGSTGDATAELTQAVSTFSVTVPSALPVHVDELGNVTVATNARITNNSAGPVLVSTLMLDVPNDWTLVWGEDSVGSKVGSNKFSLSILGEAAHIIRDMGTSKYGCCYTVDYGPLSASESLGLTYDVAVSPMATAVVETVAALVVRVQWYKGYVDYVAFPVQSANPFIESIDCVGGDWSLGENTFTVSTFDDDLGVAVLLVSGDMYEDTQKLVGVRLCEGVYQFSVDLQEGDYLYLRVPGSARELCSYTPLTDSLDVDMLETFLSAQSSGTVLPNFVFVICDMNQDGVFDEVDIQFVQNIIDTGIYPW